MDNAGVRKPGISLKQLLGVVAATSIVAWCIGNYESWYGVRWTQADSAALAAELANLDGEITEGLAIRVAIDAAVNRGKSGRILPDNVQRDVWTKRFENGELVDPVAIDCYIVYLEGTPDGIEGAFTRIVGDHCTVFVGLDGSVLYFGRGR